MAHVRGAWQCAWPTNAPMSPSSAKNPSTNSTSTRCSVPPLCTTRKPSRSNSCAPPASTPQRLYIYDGAQTGPVRLLQPEQIRQDPSYGTQSNPKVWVMEEFKNAEANHLGIALPKGRLRFYRRDTDGHLEFVGENTIDHTPKDETIRLYTGNAFDIVGERKRTNYHVDSSQHWMDESFEIRVRNHKKEAVERARRRAPLPLDQLEAGRAVHRSRARPTRRPSSSP